MTEVCAAVTAAAVAVKAAELEPAGTVMEAGIVKEELLEVRLTAEPAEGARPVRMTVQVLEPAGGRLDGTHAREFGTMGEVAGAGGFSVKDAFSDAPLKVTVTAAVVVALTVVALGLNVAEVEPAGTTKEDGTVRLLLLLATVKLAPPLGAAALSPTVHVDVPGVVMDEGLHANELRVGSEPTVSVLPLAAAAKDAPVAEAAIGLVTPVLMVPTEMEGVMSTVATTPSAIVPLFTPDARH